MLLTHNTNEQRVDMNDTHPAKNALLRNSIQSRKHPHIWCLQVFADLYDAAVPDSWRITNLNDIIPTCVWSAKIATVWDFVYVCKLVFQHVNVGILFHLNCSTFWLLLILEWAPLHPIYIKPSPDICCHFPYKLHCSTLLLPGFPASWAMHT
jgi:hypothetical protein